ncbi:3-phenylpropionate/trans-cinnamate dioxygenase beta subunit [Paraburkholderia youngii]
MTETTLNRPATVPLALHHEIEQFLYHEAELLDDWRFRDWLALMSQDVHYSMRTTVNAQTRDRRRSVQPPTTWIFNDNYAQLERRIARLETGMAWAEEPPSRTRHLVSNVVVTATQDPGEFDVRLNYLSLAERARRIDLCRQTLRPRAPRGYVRGLADLPPRDHARSGDPELS